MNLGEKVCGIKNVWGKVDGAKCKGGSRPSDEEEGGGGGSQKKKFFFGPLGLSVV